jgi:RNA polymerase sigma-70 factor (ECF subfamily)
MSFPDNKTHKDEEILAISIERPSVFGLLVDRYEKAFLSTATGIVKNREEAEDIVQEAFTKVYLNAKKFKEVEGASFKSWAYKILINTSFTHYKKTKRAMTTASYDNPEFYGELADEGARDINEDIDMRILVSKTLPKMPQHLQVVMQKYYLEDKSQKDIASEENVSVATVKMRLFRAKKEFKKLLCLA